MTAVPGYCDLGDAYASVLDSGCADVTPGAMETARENGIRLPFTGNVPGLPDFDIHLDRPVSDLSPCVVPARCVGTATFPGLSSKPDPKPTGIFASGGFKFLGPKESKSAGFSFQQS